jgi:hypothetical protein
MYRGGEERDEFHLTLLVPMDWEEDTSQAIQKVLTSRSFRSELRQTIRQVFHNYPEHVPVRVRITVWQ